MRKGKVVRFNAVIEGTYKDGWSTLHYKLTNLEVPEDIRLFRDGTYTFHLFGETRNFASVQRSQNIGLLEMEIDSLSFGPGIVLPFRGGIPNIFERPRAVTFRDGRIFVEDHMMQVTKYVDAIPEILLTAQQLFTNATTAKYYKKVMARCNFGKEK